MNFGLHGKTALVLGGGGGLGGAIACALAREGARVAVADINDEAVGTTVKAIEAHGSEGLRLHWDLSDLSIVDQRIEAVESRFGGVDILINNTGGPPPTPAAGQQSAIWMKYFQMMVLSVIAITDRVLPSMRSQRWGRVITSTSSGVVIPIANLGISNALRMALVGWSKTLAREVGAEGITVNVVLPGRIATRRILELDAAKAQRENRDVEAISAESQAAIPIGRYGRPEEYADVVAFLASERASYVTGSMVRVDGGLVPSV